MYRAWHPQERMSIRLEGDERPEEDKRATRTSSTEPLRGSVVAPLPGGGPRVTFAESPPLTPASRGSAGRVTFSENLVYSDEPRGKYMGILRADEDNRHTLLVSVFSDRTTTVEKAHFERNFIDTSSPAEARRASFKDIRSVKGNFLYTVFNEEYQVFIGTAGPPNMDQDIAWDIMEHAVKLMFVTGKEKINKATALSLGIELLPSFLSILARDPEQVLEQVASILGGRKSPQPFERKSTPPVIKKSAAPGIPQAEHTDPRRKISHTILPTTRESESEEQRPRNNRTIWCITAVVVTLLIILTALLLVLYVK